MWEAFAMQKNISVFGYKVIKHYGINLLKTLLS